MMKKTSMVKTGIALLTAMLVLGFAGCGKGGGGGGGDANNANLRSLQLNGQAVTSLGTPNANYNSITNGQIGNAVVFNRNVIATAETEIAGAEVLFARVEGPGPLDLSDLWDGDFTGASAFNAAGDFLAVEVTSSNGNTKRYYKIAVTVADVALETITIDGRQVIIPNPATTTAAAVAGAFLFNDKGVDDQNGGFTVAATAVTAGATIKYAVTVGDAVPAFGDATSFTFADGGFLWIEVESATGSKAYYKIAVNFMQFGVIKYGTVEVRDNFIDPKWDDPSLEIYVIDKEFPGDSTAEYTEDLQGQTYGHAKALFDEDGLYIYVRVWDPDVSTVAKAGSEAHQTDSIELFVNEASPLVPGTNQYALGGSQYRVGANGERSGEGDGPAALEALNRTSAWKLEDGYIVIFQAPWRLRDRFAVEDQKQIGFEIQINAAPEVGQRYATLVWNNVAHTNYMRTDSYGIATLDATGHTLVFPAVAPRITRSPAGAPVAPDAAVELSVAANTHDGGTLSWQWYKATTATGTGTPISGATGQNFSTTAASEEGQEFYYVVVTNTLINARGTTTAATRSATATITVTNTPLVERLTLRQTNAIYRFDLPSGETFGNYEFVTADYYFDSTNFAKNVRWNRLMGNYKEEDFQPSGQFLLAPFNDFNAPYIYDDLGGAWGPIANIPGAAANTWFTVQYRLVANQPHGDFNSANKPQDSDTGPFYFGLGIPENDGLQNIHFIKNITMVHKTDPSKNVTTNRDGFGNIAFTGNSGAAGIGNSNRAWAADPASGESLDEDFVLDYTSNPLINDEPIEGETYKVIHRIDLGADFDITKYATFTIEMRVLDEDLNEVSPVSGQAQMKWRNTTSTLAAMPAANPHWRWDTGNIGNGLPANTNGNIPAYLHMIGVTIPTWDDPIAATMGFAVANADNFPAGPIEKVRYLDIENTNISAIEYIEISKITFFLAD